MSNDIPDPTAWWSTLSPEARKVWFQLITGWSIEDTIKAACARATGEPVMKPVEPIAALHPKDETEVAEDENG